MRKGKKRGTALVLAMLMTFPLADVPYGGTAEAAEVKTAGTKQYYDISSGNSVLISDSGNSEGYQILSQAGDYTVDGKSIALYRWGDADQNADGVLSSFDLVGIKKAEKTGITNASSKASDVNSDGTVDQKDAAVMRKWLIEGRTLEQQTKGVTAIAQGIMPIVGSYGPVAEDMYQTVADLGINTVVIDTCDLSGDQDQAVALLQAAEAQGIKVYLNDSEKTDPDKDQIHTTKDLANANAAYDAYASFAGYYVTDGVYNKKQATSPDGEIPAENGVAQYKDLLKNIEQYQNVSSYFNLLSLNSSKLAYSMDGDADKKTVNKKEYRAYVRAAAKAGADYLGYDFLLRDDGSETLNLQDFYQNLDIISALSKEEEVNKPFYGTVQVGSYYDTVNTKDSKEYLPTASEMYLQAGVSLAFGAKGIRYNVLCQPEAYAKNTGNDYDPYDYGRSGLISYNGKENANYAGAAKNINAFIRATDNVLMAADHKGVIATDDAVQSYIKDSQRTSTALLEGVSGAHVLVGCFNCDGQDVYLITNTSVSETASATLRFAHAISGKMTAFDTTETNVSGKDLTVILKAGECALLMTGTAADEKESAYEARGMQATVEKAAQIKNRVQAYYTDSNRTAYTIENPAMKLTHGTKKLTSLTTAEGEAYLGENAIRVYVTDQNDQYYYSDSSSSDMRVNTTKLGYYYYETKLQNLNFGSSLSGLYLEKSYHTYPDKVNQAVRLIKTDKMSQTLKNAGYLITIPKDKVRSIQLDGNVVETFTSGTVVSDSAAFDIEGVGVIGFIMTGQGLSSQITGDDNGYYLWMSKAVDFGSGDEFSFASRIYTDTTHTFDGFAQAVYEEKNPLTVDNITVTEVEGASFTGYDRLTGAYAFTLGGTDFSYANANPQMKFYEHIHVKNVTDDRLIWLHVHTDHDLEAAVVVDGAKQLPIPMQTSKNFAKDNVVDIYEKDETTWGDSYMPLAVRKDEEYDFYIVHLYQNWGGTYPLKQLSSIEYFTSYYHLSNGLMETNCIAPYYSADASGTLDFSWFLPDFRGVSCDTKSGDAIQKNSVGRIYAPGPAFSHGSKATSVANSGNYQNSVIRSSGMTYADLDYSYVSADGAYEYTMRHVEMPQTDESRTYYTISFTFNKDTTLKADNFQILGMDGRVGSYDKIWYLNSSGETKEGSIPSTKHVSAKTYQLHEQSSYFTFNKFGSKDKEAGNLGVIIQDAGGKALALKVQRIADDATLTKAFCYLTFNDTVSFKAGDTYEIDLILLPYGGSYNDASYTSVQNVYEDSVTEKLALTAETGTVTDDVIPTVAAKDNEAVFTVSKGTAANATSGVNYTMKVTGFTENFLPAVYKKTDDQWEAYDYATELGWDGYTVEYDKETQTYAYSFVFTKEAADMTFRVTRGTSHSVSYYVGGSVVCTKTYKNNEVTTEPSAEELGLKNQGIAGYYTDIACVEDFEHGSVLNEDVDVYVEPARELRIEPKTLYEEGGTNKGTDTAYKKVLNEDQTVTITGSNDSQTYLNDLDVEIAPTSTLYVKVKKSADVKNMRMFLLGEFTLDGKSYDTSEQGYGEGNGYADGTLVGTTDADGYGIYAFTFHQWTGSGNTNALYFSRITDINIALWTDSSAANMQIASIYTKQSEVSGNVTVTYQIGAHTTTETVAAGSRVPYPSDMAANAYTYGREILGYYADESFTKKYDFGNWITEDVTIYVKLSDTFYLNPLLCTMTGSEFASKNLSATETDGKYLMTGSHGGYWQVTFSQIWTNVTSDQVMLMKVKGDASDKYLYARVWGTNADGTEQGYAGHKMYGTRVGTDTDGYSIYEFPDITKLSTIKGIRLDAYGNMPESAPLELVWIKNVTADTQAKPHTVSFWMDGTLKLTKQVQDGDKISCPTEAELDITDRKVYAVYTSQDQTATYDFDAAVTTDLNLYVQTKAYLNLGTDFYKSGSFGLWSATMEAKDDTLVFTKTADGVILNRINLDFVLGDGQKICLLAKTDGFTGIMAYPIGTYIENGKETTITGATGGYNWWFTKTGTTEDGYTVYEIDLTQANDSGHQVRFQHLSGLRIDLSGGETGATFTLKQIYTK